jgi:thiamine transport system substrate-binding protein
MRKTLFKLIVVVILLAGCGTDGEPGTTETAPAQPTTEEAETTPEETATSEPEETAEPVELTLMTHDSFNVTEEVLAQFEEENGVTLVLLPSGDTGTALNQAILARENPLADVFFGVDNTFLSRALEADIFEPYDSPALENVPDRFRLDDTQRMLPVDYGDVCLNYDKAFFEESGLEPPQSLDDLIDPDYRGLLVAENPATSSPGLAFLLTTIANYGTEGEYTYLDYWSDLRENDVLITNDWNNAYYSNFTVASDGDRPIVVSYASSPPAEVIFADPPLDEAPSAAVTTPGTCFRQIEFVGILRGTEQRQAAEALVDFMLGETFQEDIPLNMFVYPVNENAQLPEAFATYSELADEVADVDPAEIEANREAWLEAWTETVLR